MPIGITVALYGGLLAHRIRKGLEIFRENSYRGASSLSTKCSSSRAIDRFVDGASCLRDFMIFSRRRLEVHPKTLG